MLASSNSSRSTCSPGRSVVSPPSSISSLLQHLADDHLDMLVVDLHALQTIDLLDFVDEVDRQFLDALDAQNVMRARVAFDDEVALLHIIAFADADVLGLRQQIFDRFLLLVLGLQDHAALVLIVLAELDIAIGFGQHRAILRLARFEQFRHPRQTAGDVTGLGTFGRDTRQHVAGLHFGPVFHRQDGIHGQGITRFARRGGYRLALLVDDGDGRTQIRALGEPARQSMIFFWLTPVVSSATSVNDKPSEMSSYRTMPSTSVRIGNEFGFHSAIRSPRLMFWPSSTIRRAP